MNATSETLHTGAKAPQFSLPDQNGQIHHLTDYLGRWVVLYWYPKDDTPGCTKEACGFRDQSQEFKKLGAVVLGASILDAASKQKFAKKFNLNFPLLADESHATAQAYGVWKEKSMYGKTYWGISRETFLIAPDGTVSHHWDKAKGSEVHSEEILEVLRGLAGKGQG